MTFTVMVDKTKTNFKIEDIKMRHMECGGGDIISSLEDRRLHLECERCKGKERFISPNSNVELAKLASLGGTFIIDYKIGWVSTHQKVKFIPNIPNVH